jgi:hypothetical protein
MPTEKAMSASLVASSPFAHIRCVVDDIVDLGPGPAGHRRVVAITGGSCEGRLAGAILPGGADWQVVRDDGVIEIEARYVIETGEGARVLVESRGLRHGPPDVMAALARGEDVDPGLYFFRTLIRFETGSADHAWLNRIMAIGRAKRERNAVLIDLFEIG